MITKLKIHLYDKGLSLFLDNHHISSVYQGWANLTSMSPKGVGFATISAVWDLSTPGL